MNRTQGHSAGVIIKLIEIIHFIGIRTRDIPACSIVSQPSTLLRAPEDVINVILCSNRNHLSIIISWLSYSNTVKVCITSSIIYSNGLSSVQHWVNVIHLRHPRFNAFNSYRQ
jgi:hypothetical protein